MVQEICQLACIDRFEALLLEIVHELFEVLLADVVHALCFFLCDAMEHNYHNNGPRCCVTWSPSVMKVLAGVFDIGVRCIERVKLACHKRDWKRGRRTEGCRGGDRRIRRDGSPCGLQLCEGGLEGLRQRGVDVGSGCRGGRRLARCEEKGKKQQDGYEMRIWR